MYSGNDQSYGPSGTRGLVKLISNLKLKIHVLMDWCKYNSTIPLYTRTSNTRQNTGASIPSTKNVFSCFVTSTFAPELHQRAMTPCGKRQNNVLHWKQDDLNNNVNTDLCVDQCRETKEVSTHLEMSSTHVRLSNDIHYTGIILSTLLCGLVWFLHIQVYG
jgi:hypothetical protein